MRRSSPLRAAALGLALALGAASDLAVGEMPETEKPPTVDEARAFLEQAEASLLKLSVDASRASWVQSTFITDDTEILAAQANEKLISASADSAKKAARFSSLTLPPDLARKILLLKNSLTLAAPADPKKSEELTRIAAALEGAYGKGKYCPAGRDCLDLEEITKIMAESRDEKQLWDVWQGWHAIGPPLKTQFERYVTLANEGARELGFADTGAMWRSKYDMPPDAFAKEVDRLWE